MALNAISYSPAKHWFAAGSCLTSQVHKKFEEWKNDFQPKHYSRAASTTLIHLGNPCDRPKDIRARKWILAWATPDLEPPPELVNTKRPVYCAVYHCSGNCRHGSSEEDEGGSDRFWLNFVGDFEGDFRF
ncbi:hypothetical protein B0H14DRAFT_3069798 [Mycena olivaceomarginata]|nr:hypothetical protein B0H14DRAFT_3069798 [Mycena olivaceomarginata]